MAGQKKQPTTISRSAKSGKFVTEKYANGHKSTTVTETVKPAKKSK